jgi:hypothetical protein
VAGGGHECAFMTSRFNEINRTFLFFVITERRSTRCLRSRHVLFDTFTMCLCEEFFCSKQRALSSAHA